MADDPPLVIGVTVHGPEPRSLSRMIWAEGVPLVPLGCRAVGTTDILLAGAVWVHAARSVARSHTVISFHVRGRHGGCLSHGSPVGSEPGIEGGLCQLQDRARSAPIRAHSTMSLIRRTLSVMVRLKRPRRRGSRTRISPVAWVSMVRVS